MISIYKKTGELALMVDTSQYQNGGWLVISNADLTDCDLAPVKDYYVAFDECTLTGCAFDGLDFRMISFSTSRWSRASTIDTVVLKSLTPTQIAQSINADTMFSYLASLYREAA